MKPEISIIVPVYNVEDYLAECINSVLSQTFTNYELLLIDDGSTDRSSVICDSFQIQDSRISVFHVENKGVSAARNLGLKISTGEFIFFLDSDDIIPSSALEKLYQAIKETKLSYVKGEHQYLKNGAIISSAYAEDKKKYNKIVVDNSTFLSDILRREFYSWNILYRKTFLVQNGILFPVGISICEDTLFLVKMLSIKSYGCYLSENTYILRYRPNSASSSLDFAKIESFLKVLIELQNILKGKVDEILRGEILKIISTGTTYAFTALVRLPDRERKILFVSLKQIQPRVRLCGNLSQIFKALLYNISPKLLYFLLKKHNEKNCNYISRNESSTSC